jgi:hypothetical protein
LVGGFPADQWGVEVVIGSVVETLASPTRHIGPVQVTPGGFLAAVDGLGRMHVTPARVTLDPDPDRTAADMEFMICGRAPRWIRLLCEKFSLHASAIRR